MLSRIKGLLSTHVAPFFRLESYAQGRRLQERADLLQLFLLASYRKSWPNLEVLAVEDVLANAPTLDAQRQFVGLHVKNHAIAHLTAWHAERPPPLPPSVPEAPLSPEDRARVDGEYARAIDAAQRRAFGFAVSVAPSAAPGSDGKGVFISGEALPGSVVAIFPGVTYTPPQLHLLPNGQAHFEGNRHLMLRHDGCIIDGSPRATKLVHSSALANPLSVAHLVNHPPAGMMPNVVPAALDIDVTLPAQLLPLLPNISFAQARSQLLLESGDSKPIRTWLDMFRESLHGIADEEGSVHVFRGLVLVSTRVIKDEELYMNYRLNPHLKYPDWYTPVDREEDLRRWTF